MRSESPFEEKTSSSMARMSAPELVEDHCVVPHHLIEDGVEDRARPAGEPTRIGLELVPGLDEPAGLTVADRHREVRVDENQDLAELDDLDRVGVTSRLGDDEECLVESLQLGSLVCAQCVVDRQLVKVERLDRFSNSSGLGSCRPTQAKTSRSR